MQVPQPPAAGLPPERPITTPAAEATAGHPAPATPRSWRMGIGLALAVLVLATYASQAAIGPRGQSLAGMVFFFGLVAMFSSNLRAVNWRTIACGIVLQMGLALLVLHGRITLAGHEYSVYHAIERVGDVVKAFIDCSDQGAKFVFGNLADPASMQKVFGEDYLFAFAFKALPPILFLSAFFTVLYHFGVLQACVRLAARIMQHLMHTSGAETLSVAANVFMGQTEAPLIVRPYIPRMTNSELFAVMTSGMAHISGGLMAVYISYGANPVAVLTTCVMACPCSLYLSKLFLPELGRPETSGTVETESAKSPYVNAIDAAAAGTSDGLQLALNVGAMLIVFIAFVALCSTARWPGCGRNGFNGPGWDLPERFLAPLDFWQAVHAGGDADRGRIGRSIEGWHAAGLQTVDQRTRGLSDDAFLDGPGRRHVSALLPSGGLRPDRLREFRLGRHSIGRHRRHRARSPPRPGPLGNASAVRRLRGHAVERLDRWILLRFIGLSGCQPPTAARFRRRPWRTYPALAVTEPGYEEFAGRWPNI